MRATYVLRAFKLAASSELPRICSGKRVTSSYAMAVQLDDIDINSPSALEKLDEYLLTRSYISGSQASRDDLTVYTALSSAPDSKFVNLSRWYSHISALPELSFPGTSAGVEISGAPASSATRDFTLVPAPPTPEAVPVPAAPAATASPVVEQEDGNDDRDLIVGKSSILMDVKPWDDETDLKLLEEAVRSVEKEGLTWGASKLVAVGYGMKKLQILLTVIDDV